MENILTETSKDKFNRLVIGAAVLDFAAYIASQRPFSVGGLEPMCDLIQHLKNWGKTRNIPLKDFRTVSNPNEKAELYNSELVLWYNQRRYTPPHPGWWLTSGDGEDRKKNEPYLLWRWFSPEGLWSIGVISNAPVSAADEAAKHLYGAETCPGFYWSEYWPKNARVQRGA
jgi:hypothetical protein